MYRFSLSMILFLFGTCLCSAQFRALQDLPWYPTASNRELIYPTDDASGKNVLDELNDAFQTKKYVEVVNVLYPRAIKEGYQRNTVLYNNTRKALRELMRQDVNANWKIMQNLYRDRFSNIGREAYEYRYTLEGSSWNEEQLQNEYIAALADQDDQYMEAYKTALKNVQKSKGQIDLAVVLLGMFSPLNRAHSLHPEVGTKLTGCYQEIIQWMDVSADYMEQNHNQEYHVYYPQSTLEQVHQECLRVIDQNQAKEQNKVIQVQKEAASDYSKALIYYRHKNYNSAYNTCVSALKEYDTPELHTLKSNILQAAGNESANSSDRVAYWIAAYESGVGYVSSRTLSRLLKNIQDNLFMSGVAGQVHRTGSPIILSQKIWTLEQLKEKTSK